MLLIYHKYRLFILMIHDQQQQEQRIASSVVNFPIMRVHNCVYLQPLSMPSQFLSIKIRLDSGHETSAVIEVKS